MSADEKTLRVVLGWVLIFTGSFVAHAAWLDIGLIVLGIGWWFLGYCAGKPTKRGEVISGS